jgi:hypothetical protein
VKAKRKEESTIKRLCKHLTKEQHGLEARM